MKVTEGTSMVPQKKIDDARLIQEIGDIFTRSLYMKNTITQVLEVLQGCVGILDCFLYLQDDPEVREIVGGEFFFSPAKYINFSAIEPGLEKLCQNKEASFIYPEHLPFPGDYGLEAGHKIANTHLLVCPIKHKSMTLGVIAAAQNKELKSAAKNLPFLATIASMISLSLQIKSHKVGTTIATAVEPKLDKKSLNFIGNSKAMQGVYEHICQVANSETTTLVLGESGVGKELVANAIHYNSGRADKPFVKVNCAALPDNLLESELFGYEKGAFTGAIQQKKGRFEIANGGTLFLDEIGDFSASTQVKLLRVLQEKEFERVGGTTSIQADVRIIAATNRNLEEMIARGHFRQDLYYRLNVFQVHMPPLRERKTDILLLADHFVEKYSQFLKKEIRRISTPAIDMLMSYHWPGNVRELENCIERAVLISNDKVIHSQHLPPTLQTAEGSNTSHKRTLRATLDTVEKEVIIESLKSTRGNIAQAARELGVTERIMGLRVRKFRINSKRFKENRH